MWHMQHNFYSQILSFELCLKIDEINNCKGPEKKQKNVKLKAYVSPTLEKQSCNRKK